MKSFLDYISENQKEYKFTIKLAVDEIDDRALDKLESCLQKYDLVAAEKFKKTPLLKHPIDFPRVTNSEVFTTDIITRYPVTRDLLEVQISEALKIDRHRVVVYSENDPRRISSYIHEDRPQPHAGIDYSEQEQEDFSDSYLDKQADAAMDDYMERKAERKVYTVIDELTPEQAFKSAKFEKQKPDTEVKRSLFFGRAKD